MKTLAFTLVLAFAAPALSSPSGSADAVAAETRLRRVDVTRVCMVTDRLFDKEQFAVEIAGRTYFGCCPMCKERLAAEAGLRTAVDPVTGKPVDKATAVPAADAEGRVLYFEDEKSLLRFTGTGS